MKIISVGNLKTHFSEVLKSVAVGERIAITYGRKKKIKTLLVPKEIKKVKRKPGVPAGKASCVFIGGHNTTPEEFFGS